jgi:hypothetical protein
MTARAPRPGADAPRRALRILLGALAAVALAAAVPGGRAGAQTLDRTVRLPVATVGDSTFTFPVGELRWVRTGVRGMAVDPRRRDAMVARFEVLAVDHGMATALVTGETTRLTPEHVAVLEVPVRPWYANGVFWTGALLGLLGGAALASH